MNEYCLYGVKAFTEFPLFDRPAPISAVAPGEPHPVELRQLPEEAELPSLPQRVTLGSSHGRELCLSTDRELARSAPSQPWCLEVGDVVTLAWTGAEPLIHYQLHEQATRELLVFWFVHIFLPLHLTLERGYDFIHGAAVEVDEQPVVFIAPSTGGKSTLADYFLKQDHPMLSDDKVATFLERGRYYAVPSHPHHRPFREFEVLGYPVDNFARQARPIHAFYILEAAEPDADIEITEVTGFRKFEQMLPNYMFSFRFLQEQRLHWLAQLVDQSLVFRVSRPWSLDRMHEVYETICAHSRSLPGSGI
jgi:hypothetical protein